MDIFKDHQAFGEVSNMIARNEDQINKVEEGETQKKQ